MAVTASNATFSASEVRSGLKCSWVSSSTGFLTKGATVEDDHYLRNAAISLRMVHPRPATELTFTSVWNKWVTNAPLKLYPSAVGGCFPYIWSLVNAPSGMTIDSPTLTDNSTYNLRAAHGRITWPSPAAGDYTFYVRCTDQAGNQVTEKVTMNIADSNAIWCDAVSGTDSTGAAGTKAAPFKKIDNWYGGAGGMGAGDRASTTYANKLLILRAGTYAVPEDESAGNLNMGSNKPCSWVAYDTEAPVLDCTNSSLRWAASNGAGTINRAELIGITTKYEDSVEMADSFQVYLDVTPVSGESSSASCGHVIICDHTVDSWKNAGTANTDNPGALRNSDPGNDTWQYRCQFRNVQIANLGGGSQPLTGTQPSVILMLGTRQSEYNNIALNSQDGACNAVVKLKHKHRDTAVRNSSFKFSYDTANAVAPMMGGGGTLGDNLQLEYCRIGATSTSTGYAMNWGANSGTEGHYGDGFVRRCTFDGRHARLTNFGVTSCTMTRGSNVCQSSTVSTYTTGWEDNAAWSGSVTQESTDIAATSGMIDSSGLLTGASRTSYLGLKGWEIA